MGRSNVAAQLRSSSWRHYLFYLRHWPWVVGAVLLAVAPFVLLAALKTTVPLKHQHVCHFRSRLLWSGSPLATLQSFVCNLHNTCHQEGEDDLVDHYPGAPINVFLNSSVWWDGDGGGVAELMTNLPTSLDRLAQVAQLLTNPTLVNLMETGLQVRDVLRSPDELSVELTTVHHLQPQLVSAILGATLNVSRILSLVGYRDLKGVVCSPEQLSQFLVTWERSQVDNISATLCQLPLDQAANITRVFTNSLDPGPLLAKVSEVLEAIGGYEAEQVVRQVGSLLASLGRLEALAPLASTLNTLSTALRPLTSAINTLTASAWDHDSLSKLLSLVQSLSTSSSSASGSNTSASSSNYASSTNTSALHAVHSAMLLLSPYNLSLLAAEQESGDQWAAVLRMAGSSVGAVGEGIGWAAGEVQRHPATHTLLTLATTLLPTLLQPTTLTPHRLGEALDNTKDRLLPEVSQPITKMLTILHPAVTITTTVTEAAHILLRRVLSGPQLPPALALMMLTHTNHSLIQALISGERADVWACERASWPGVSSDDWLLLEAKLCGEAGVRDLQGLAALHQSLVTQIRSQDGVNASQVVRSIVRLSEVIQSSADLLNLLPQDGAHNSSEGSRVRKKRSIVEGVDALLPQLPPGNHQEIQKLQKGLEFFKDVVNNLTVVMVNMTREMVREDQGGGGHLHLALLNTTTTTIHSLAGVTSTVVEMLVRLATLFQQPWKLSDVIHNTHVKSLLYLLPVTVMEVVENVYYLLEEPRLELPPPLPQLVEVLNASYSVLSNINSGGDLWWWCAGGCPIMASLVQPAAALVLPRLLALPYLMTTRPLAWHQTVAGLMNQTSSGSWSQYPCGNVTLVDLFPPASVVADLPASWSHLEEIKHKVLDLEYLACHNVTDIVEELLASSTQLSGSVKALMEDFTPGDVEVGAALRLARSFGHLLASFNLSRILDGITTPQGTSIQQEFQDAFVITGEVKQQLYASMVLEVADEVLEWMVGYEDTRPLAHMLQYTMYHAHALATTLSALLQDEMTLTSVWGLPEDYPLLQVFRQGPAGTATFILHQVSSFVTTALLEREVLWWWAERACNQSVGVSVMVEVVCYYAYHPHQPPHFQSNLTTALVRALTEYQKPEIKVPQIGLVELYDQCRILVGQLQQFDFNKSLNVSDLQQFWDETINEMRVLLAGLADLQKQWPWLVVDALVDRSQDLLQVLKKSYSLLTWLHGRLLQVNPGNLTESIPSYIINFHSIINSTWIDLLDGLDYNLLLNSSFINLTLPEFCSSASSLEEPPASNGQFQKAVGAVCDQLSQFTPVNLNMWLQYKQMINDLNNKTLTFSSFKFKSLVSGVVNQTNTLIDGFLNVQPANSISASDLYSASFSLTLPSYLLEENWNILLRRIGKRYQDSSLKSVEPAVKMVLQWLGVDQNHLDTFLKFVAFQIFNLKSFQAHNLQELLVDSPALWQLAETVIQYLPTALKDVITTASGRPHVVAELLSSPQKLDDWSSMCGFDFQEVGDDFHTFVTRLCQVIPEELIREIRVLIKLDILQSSVNITLEDVINSSIAVSAQLIQQVEDGSFIQKIYRPLEYLGAQNWTQLANMIFSVTAEEMFDNSTMILATLLEPLVELSRESTNNGLVIKAALQSLDKYLRWGRLLLALSRGGDIWMGIKEAYVDKPVVIRFLDIVENLPEFVWEYINFFGNSTVVANDILLHQDTPCNLHLFLLDGHRDLLGYNASSILTEVLEYVCEEHQMSLLMTQLLPDSSPVIANVTMDVDAAMLALLIDYIAWDIIYIIQGDYFEGDLQVSPWMDGQKWEKVLYKFTNFSVSVKEMIAASTSFGLLDTVRKYQGDLNINPGASLVYNLATRLTNSIDGLTGNFNACLLVEGLGPVEDLCHLAAPRIPDLVALILWFPESEVYYSFASGISPSVVYKEMCKAGVNATLLHPGLNEEDWGALQEMFCSYKLQYANVMPLFNTSQIMTGLSIDWMKVFSSLDNLMGRLNIMNIEQFEKPLVDNPFMTELRNLTTVQKFVHGVFFGVSAFQQWSLSNENTSFKHIFAQILITANAALAPITKLGVPSLYERLLDPQLFKGLLKDYSHVVQDIQKKEAEMSLQYRLYLGSSLSEEMEHREIASASQETTKNTTHAHLLSELRTTILNLTRSLIPPDMSSEMAMAGSDFVMTVFSNLVQNVEGALSVVKTPACYYILSGEEFISTLQHVSTYVDVVQKHVEHWESYVNLTCEVPESNLTQVVMKLLHDFGWEEDIKQMINNNDGTQQSFTCEFVFDQSASISEKVKDLVSYYLQDEVAEKHLSSCLIAAVNSTVGVQFRGILRAAGDLFGLASSKNIGEALSAATTSLPGASSALRTLGSRVAVLVPFEDILVKHYETTLNFTTKVIDIITNDLMVDVNRIYGADSSRLASLLSTVDKMKKWIRIRNKAKDTGSVFKRSVQDMPIEILYQAAQDMGHYSFAENLLANVNYTYLLSEIENMRMQAILSSDWLDPVLIHMNFAVTSLSELSKLGAVMDLNKIVTGDVDPVTFLTGSVQLLQMKLWTDLALSFGGILGEAVPVITGSELGDDLQRVVDGIGTLQAAKNLGIVDFTMPTTALISNWTEMQQYLKNILMMDSEVIEALKNSELNLMALLSLEDVTLEEVICGESQVERVVTLPVDTQVTFATLSKYLCNSSDSQGLAATFLQHLDLAPLIVTLVKYGLNSSLSSHGMTLEQVTDAVNILVETSSMLPSLTSSFSALSDLMNVLKEHDASEKMVKNDTHTILKAISSPAFLERAGHALCGQPLLLVPDSLGVLLENHKENVLQHDPYNKNICDALYSNIRSLPGGGVLLHYIKPLMMGKIFYTPYNNITQGIIAYANETFEMVEKQVETLKLLQESTRQLVSVSTRHSGLQKLQSSLQMPWVQGFMQQVFPASLVTSVGEQLKDASPKLQEASKFAKEFSDVIELGVNLVSCIDLQRFIPVNNEEKLLKKARRTAKKKEFLAGIVFAGVGETGDTGGNLPHNLTYTIRVDSEKSPSTFYLKPRFWNPGAYADMALDMKYHQGFLQLQDVMERAIIKFQYVNDNPSHSLKATPLNNFDYQKQSPGVSELSKAIEAPSLESGRRKRQAPVVLTEEEENMLLSLPIYTKQQPYPCYNKDDFTKMLNLSPMMSLLFSLITFIIFVVFLIRQLVQESESRNRQLQVVMGLRLWLDRLVWLFFSLVFLLVIVLLVALIDKFGGLQANINFGVLFTFLFCYGLSIISFCYLVSCLVPSTVLATFVGLMGLLVFNVPYISISVIQAKIPFSIIILTSLLPSTAFGFGFRVICQYELLQESLDYKNLWIEPVRDSDMTLGLAITMLLVDSGIFIILSVIISSLKKDGPQHLSTSGKSDVNPKPTSLKRSNEFTVNIFQEDAVHILDLDPGLKQSLKKGLSVVGLRRIFEHRGRSKVAVDNLNLELYEGQVLVLLGHNGAGKTTIISMLTRELIPTAGSIQVYGHDIHSAWDKARRLMGLCPQQSVLFPFMTVQEVLHYYAILKDSASNEVQIDINTVLLNMALFNHRDYLVSRLSEGMRRRLCMAIAFIGNSKLVILDEPTSGIDPTARNAIWEIISNNRAGRTILLTTHHLDEAETLADRVAILNQGRLLCVGSPLSLKSEHGLGYTLTLSNTSLYEEIPLTKAKKLSILGAANLEDKMPPPTDVIFSVARYDDMWELIKKHVPNARLLENVNGEVTYSLPLCDSHGTDNRLAEMFDEVEKHLEELGFSSLEIRPTSLEDVIIALGATSCNVPPSHDRSRVKPIPEIDILPEKENIKNIFNFKPEKTQQGVRLGIQKFSALIMKRLLHHGRDWRFYIQMLVLPLVFMTLAMIGSKCRPIHKDPAPLALTPRMYSPPITAFTRTLDRALKPVAEEFLQLSIGRNESGGSWSTCPSIVADTNPGLPLCNISALDVSSLCQCNDGRCIVDASNQPRLNDWLLGTRWQHIRNSERHGGVTLGVEDPRMGINSSGAMVWYENSGYHTLPAYINMFNNARLRRLLGKDYSITTVNKPIAFSNYGFGSMSFQQIAADVGIGLLILVSLTVVCSATVGYVTAERIRGERRVLYVAGISRRTYWITNMIWDVLVLFIIVLLIAILLVIFNEQMFIWRENLAAFILLSLLYGVSILPLFYLMESWFQTEASAVFFFFCTTFGIGIITSLLVVICQTMLWIKELKYELGPSMIILYDIAGVLKYVFLVFPPFAFAIGIKDLAVSFTKASVMARFEMDVYVSPFSWDLKMQGGLGLHYFSLALWTVVGTVVLLSWQDCLGALPKTAAPAKNLAGAEEEKDVAAERIKIQCGGTSLYDTVLRLVGLGRDFASPPTTAVSNLFLALRRGECFSLLGLNGAGKTTTFRCLTGDLRPTRGQILVNGLVLEEALALPYPIMGYCPQSHALDPNLTAREALSIMALIRGFSSRETTVVLERVIEQLGLSGEDNTYIHQLSGGTKRKLSTALALLANPLLVLLDEPTTGMDPASRRLAWRAIRSVTDDGRTVLLTSHSMDEVNQLSHRMAIMVNGQFICIGSPHYLKYKLGDKYTIRLKTNDIEDMECVLDFLCSQLADVLLKEQHHLTIVAEVSRQLPLRLIFDTLNTARSMGVTEYDVSQTTLNEVFRVLTSNQGDGQVPPPPVTNNFEQVAVPIHLSNQLPVDIQQQSPDIIFQPPANVPHSSLLPSVEEQDCTSHDRESLYDNVETDKQEIYATVGKVSSMRKPSPDLYQENESGSADDSPEEEWTHL